MIEDGPPPEIEEQLLRRQSGLPIMSATEFSKQNQGDDQPLIDGILRIGETANIIASPKIGKTWLVAGIGLSIANGIEWMGYRCTRGKVLVIDCELRPRTLRWRYEKVAEAMQVALDNLDMLSLRGDGRSIVELGAAIRRIVNPGEYVAIVWDALYRLLPRGASENDNAAMMGIYNELDAIASHTGQVISSSTTRAKGIRPRKLSPTLERGLARSVVPPTPI